VGKNEHNYIKMYAKHIHMYVSKEKIDEAVALFKKCGGY
jgi:hypothetical protein